MLIKTCPACGLQNKVTEILCSQCMADLTSILPTEEGQQASKNNNNDDATKLKPKNIKLVELTTGTVFIFQDGDVIGRNNIGHRDMTISRQHAKIFYLNGQWNLEDAGSTNGTYINQVPLHEGGKHPLKNNDVVTLSNAIDLRVMI